MCEQIIKRIFEKSSQHNPTTTCPDPESLAMYMENRLEKRQRRLMEKHFVECDTCMEEIVLCSTLKKEEVVRQAIRGAADVVVKFVKQAVEVISDLKDITVLPELAPVLVRGSLKPMPATARFNKEFNDLSVEIAITKANGETGEIRIGAYKDKNPQDKIRISLLSGKKEMASYLTKNGQVNFQYDEMGNYLIRLSKNSFYLGEISIELRDC
jgi:hypothetical protein